MANAIQGSIRKASAFCFVTKITVLGKRKDKRKREWKSRKCNVVNGFFNLSREWSKDEILIEFPTKIYATPMPDAKNKYAFMEGPVVLAGITDNDPTLKGDIGKAESILVREYEHDYKIFPWKQSHYRTINQSANIQFIPLYEVADEHYTIYFPIQK